MPAFDVGGFGCLAYVDGIVEEDTVQAFVDDSDGISLDCCLRLNVGVRWCLARREQQREQQRQNTDCA